MASLAGTLPDLQAAYAALASIGAQHGITFTVADYGGVRTQADTNAILNYRQADFSKDVAAGRVPADTTLQHYRPIAAFGTSFHNYGAAFDVSIVARPSSMSEAQAQAFLGQFANSVGLRWGGNFSKNPDPPHFELAIALDDAKARYQQMVQGDGSSAASSDPGTFSSDFSSDFADFTPTATDFSVGSDPFSGGSGDNSGADDFTGDVGDDTTYDDSGAGSSGSATALLFGGVVVVVLWLVSRR